MERKRRSKLIGKQMLAGLMVIGMLISSFPVVSNAETATSSEEQFRQLYLRLLETGDYSQQDITDLNLLYMTCYDIMQDVRKNEGFMAYQCYLEYPLIQLDGFKGSGAETYLTKFHLGKQDDTGFTERYVKVKEMVAEVQANLDDKMTDLDKLLWINEYLVETLYYKDNGTSSDHLGGSTLFNGYGVCEGYAAAMMIFLKAEGITCETVSGGNHEWVAAKIDGEWYHTDPTWNDTRAGRDGTHCFLMRNDDEFVNQLERKHTITTSDAMSDKSSKTVSTSTAYTNWYVHDVWNRMYYYDGYWYYVQDGAVKKNNIQGTAESIVYEGSNLTITGLENGVLSVSGGEGTKQFDLRQEDVKTTEGITEKTTEVTTENTTEKATEVTTENTTEATTEKTTEGTTEEITERATEATTENTTEKATEVTTEKTTEKATEVTTEKTTEKATEVTTEKTTEKATEVTTEKTTEKATEVTTEKTTEKATEATTEKTTEKATEATTGKTTEKATEATTGKTTEEATETITEKTTEDKSAVSSATDNQKIKIEKPVIKSVTNKKKNIIKIVLKKKVAGAAGYEIKYSTNKKFKKSVKTVRFTGKSKTISKLKKNKTYYVKVRAYKKDANGNKVYGKYSKVKKIKIKK